MITTTRSRLHVELLNDRIVPSTTVLDLTAAGAVATAPNGAIVEQTNPQAAGAGTVTPFVRINNNWFGNEQGYNTDARPLQFDDESRSSKLTHAITLSQVPVVTLNGENYLEFFLGVKERGWSHDVSLDDVQIFLGSSNKLSNFKSFRDTLGGQSPVFDLDSAGDVRVKLNADLSSGDGHWNMELLVPEAAFASASPSSYLYLYSKFNGQNWFERGYVQWGIGETQPQGPAAGTISGSVFVGNANNLPIPGVTVTLTGMDSQGNPVSLSATTDSNGNFSFLNLNPGTYTLSEQPPLNNIVVGETLGTVNGVADGTMDQGNSQFTNVTLASGQSVTGYVFFDGVGG